MPVLPGEVCDPALFSPFHVSVIVNYNTSAAHASHFLGFLLRGGNCAQLRDIMDDESSSHRRFRSPARNSTLLVLWRSRELSRTRHSRVVVETDGHPRTRISAWSFQRR